MHTIRRYELGDPELLRYEWFTDDPWASAQRDLEARMTHGKVLLVPDAQL